MPRYEHRCLTCGRSFELRCGGGEHPPCYWCFVDSGDENPTEYLWRGTVTHGIQTDESFIGGKLIENLDHEPTMVYSRQELAQKMHERGLEQRIKYVPGDQHLTDWSKMIDPYTLEAAKALVSRSCKQSTDVVAPTVPVQVTIREV